MKTQNIVIAVVAAAGIGVAVLFSQNPDDVLGGLGIGGTQAFTSIDEVAAAEDAQLKSTGKYVQVLEENKLPDTEQGTVTTKLGKVLPSGYKVDTYETPNGQKGYQILYITDTTVDSRGYGPEAADRTYTIDSNAASSTKNVQIR